MWRWSWYVVIVAGRWLRGVTGHVKTSVVSGAAAGDGGGAARARLGWLTRPLSARCSALPAARQAREPSALAPTLPRHGFIDASPRDTTHAAWRHDSTYVQVCSAEPIQVAVHQFVPHRMILLKHSWLFELRYLVTEDIITTLTMGDAIRETIYIMTTIILYKLEWPTCKCSTII